MLRYLRVSNLAVVREVSLEVGEGLTVLTGETGAGKSILVDALTLLLGARASSELVRTGAEAAAVEGIFRVEGNPAALGMLHELGLAAEDGEVVLRREVGASGRGRAFVNGALQPVSALRRLGGCLADVYGQHEHVRLLEPASHLDLLDHFAGLGGTRSELREACLRLRDLEARLGALGASASERARRADFLRFELGEIEEARVEPGEDEELGRARAVLANRARILELAEGGYQRLYEREGAVLGELGALRRALEELAGYDPGLARLGAEAEGARAALEEVALELRDYARGLPFEPSRLEEVESRLALLERLKAKYGPTLAEVGEFAVRARAELQGLEGSSEEKERLGREVAQARDRYLELSAQASAARAAAAPRLEKRVEEELEELKMEKTRFRVLLLAEEGGIAPTGAERAEFHVSTNVGEEPRPLGRVASGGELARLFLALRTVVADHDPARIAVFHALEAGLGGKVAVFDEVDAGIGGRVAHVLARKLSRLASGRQVLCITHLAPVAAAAQRHLRVVKEERRGRTEVRVEPLAARARVAELGRMIGGEAVTASVVRHAEELLALLGGRAGKGQARAPHPRRPLVS